MHSLARDNPSRKCDERRWTALCRESLRRSSCFHSLVPLRCLIPSEYALAFRAVAHDDQSCGMVPLLNISVRVEKHE